jgi:ATP-dependent phosphoenolpyruvate carboxykinase
LRGICGEHKNEILIFSGVDEHKDEKTTSVVNNAKATRLSKEPEPEIYECTRKFGTILENVAFNIDTRRIDLDDARLTENTRAAYPITHIPTAIMSGRNVTQMICKKDKKKFATQP